ncbi:MAG: YecA family protein [Candidatus Hodarchaeales archaeon]|jgi:hypothetical protein
MAKKGKIKKIDYEAFKRGPLIFERFGREIGIRVQWEPGEYESYIANVKAKLSEVEDSINKKINQLQHILNEYDPLDLLQTSTTRNILITEDIESGERQDRLEGFTEYAQSIALSLKRKNNYKHATDKAINNFNSLIEEIFKDVYWYLAVKTGFMDKSDIEKEIRISSLSKFIFIRGDSIPEHHIEMITDLFSKCDDFLAKYFNITIAQIFQAFRIIENQVQDKIDKTQKYVELYNEIQNAFENFIKNKQIHDPKDEAKLFDEFRSSPQVSKRIGELAKKWQEAPLIAFEIKEEKDLSKNLLDLLSSQFGDNHEFLNFKKAPGWPTNDSVINERPLINIDGHYYCFLPTVLSRNIGTILESWIYKQNPSYYNGRYRKIKAEYLESESAKYLLGLLPGAELYRNLYYNIKENGNIKRVETDCLIIFDNNIFILECKAGSLSLSARRGSIDRIEKHYQDIIDNAYTQALRTKSYIENTEKPLFEYEDGSLAIEILDKKKYENIFLINTTFENLGILSTHLSSAKEMGFIKGKEWPYSVFINDLRIIYEINETPSIFIHYLKRRTRVNDYPQFRSYDELDYYMFYLREGLYFEDGRLDDKGRVSLFGYTNSLDKYYEYSAGRTSFCEKPSIKLPNSFIELVIDIENSKKYGFTSITTFLLNMSAEGIGELISNYKKICESNLKDKDGHQFTMALNDKVSLLAMGVCNYGDSSYVHSIKEYIRIKMYQTKRRICAFILKKILPNGRHEWEFEFINKEWVKDIELESKVTAFKKKKWAKFDGKEKKIGRNEECPCSSGLKYKHCCGK